LVSGGKPGRDSKELGKVFVPEQQKWKETKEERDFGSSPK